MKNKPKIKVSGTMIVSVIALLVLSCTLAMQVVSKEKTGFVDNATLFEGFAGKKELEKKLIRLKERHQSVLDSMRLAQPPQAAVEQAGRINRVAREFESILAEQSETFTAQAWSQINESVQEYGEANGYTYIHGAAGNGSLMYADPDKNITKEVLEYINLRYEGL